MSEMRDLYQQVIVDHAKSPRNFGRLDAGARRVEGVNPLCGDRLALYVRVDGDRVADARFEGSGCAISTASASLLTEAVRGRSVDDVQDLIRRFREAVTAPPGAPVSAEGLGKAAVLTGVREFPIRVKCATLAWHSMRAALTGEAAAVSTEA